MRVRHNVPIAWRITGGLLLASILPLLVVTYWGSMRSTQVVRAESYKNLRLIAEMSAARIDQFVSDTRHIVRGLAQAPRLVEYCRGFDGDPMDLERMISVLARSDPGILAVYITDATGHIRLSSDLGAPGMDVSFRDYWKRARAGEFFVSSILVGKRTKKAGMYFAGPIREEDGFILGVVFLKFDAEVVREFIREVHIGREGRAALADDDTIILAHGGPEDQLYTSIEPITPERIAEIDPLRRWGRDDIPRAEVGEGRVVESAGDEATFRAYVKGREYVAGTAHLTQMPWYVVAYEPSDEFEAPLREMLFEQGVSIVLVMLFAALFAFTHSRSILRPVRDLSNAAERIAGGDLETRVPVNSTDELGKLAEAFNSMIPKLESGLAMRHSLRLAKEVQANLLPAGPPEFDGLDCAGVSYSADETGGDYFDFIDLRPWDDERLLVAVGDVVGHGVAAALLMATARANLRSRARPLGDLGPLFDAVNRLLAEDVRCGQFMTLLLMAIDPVAKQAQWVNAGHNPPLHYRAATAAVDEVQTGNPPLGIVSQWKFDPSPSVPIASGDVLLMGTDGIWEAQNTAGDHFGHERLKAMLLELHQRPADAILRTIRNELDGFSAGTRQADDITIVVVKVL